MLAIDAGETSGWAMWKPGEFVYKVGSLGGLDRTPLRLGTIRRFDDRKLIVQWAVREAEASSLPLVVVGESWTAGSAQKDGRMHALTLLGLGAAWRDWENALHECRVPKNRVLRVNVQTWRAAMLKGLGARRSEQLKKAAEIVVRGRFPQLAKVSGLTSDAWEAACIALWASQSGEVGLRLSETKHWPKPKNA